MAFIVWSFSSLIASKHIGSKTIYRAEHILANWVSRGNSPSSSGFFEDPESGFDPTLTTWVQNTTFPHPRENECSHIKVIVICMFTNDVPELWSR